MIAHYLYMKVRLKHCSKLNRISKIQNNVHDFATQRRSELLLRSCSVWLAPRELTQAVRSVTPLSCKQACDCVEANRDVGELVL